ncbi:D-alanyl-D-alanine carboxypeptidase family protein [Modestobacter sp. SYSU DS0511]
MTDSSRHGDTSRRRQAGLLGLLVGLVVVVLAGGAVLVVREVRSSAPTVTARTPAPQPSAATAPPAVTPAPSTPAEPTFDRAQLSLDDPASPWVVVNKARPLGPIDHAPTDLVPVGDQYQLRAEAAEAMDAMLAAAADQGLFLSVQSAYRSYDYQVGLFDAQVSRFGEERAEVRVARPGHSEHQTGLAADVGGGGCDIETCFGTTPEGRWVADHGAEFGYVVRYPDGAQEVTGFKYEPWHVRYVGTALATELQRSGVSTLEEFFGLPAAPGYPG